MGNNHPTILWAFIAVSVLIIALFVADVANEPSDVSVEISDAGIAESSLVDTTHAADGQRGDESVTTDAVKPDLGDQAASQQEPEGQAGSQESVIGQSGQEEAEKLSPSGNPEVIVEIRDMKLIPQEITISPGTTVTWINNDGKSHKVFEVTRKFYGTRMETGDRYSFTFDAPGTYRYFDANFEEHKGLRGTINVEDPSPILITGNAVRGLSRQEDNSKFSAILVMSIILSLAVVTLVRTRRYH